MNAKPSLRNAPDATSVFAYVRCSSHKQEVARQLLSLPAAHSQLPDGLADLPLVYFYDEGISAYDGSVRPGLSEMMERIRSGGEASAVLLDTSSRLTRRGIREALAMLSEFTDAGCRLFASGKEYGFDLLGIINLAIDAEADLRYSENLSHNTRSGKRKKASDGRWPNGQRPVGYNINEEMILVPNEDAPAVTTAFALAADGEPLGAILRYFSAAVNHDYTRQGLKNILQSESYLGKVPCGDETFDGKHTPLTDPLTFRRVQKRLADASVGPVKRQPKAYALSGLARCESCGNALHFRTHKARWSYLFCQNRNCEQQGVSIDPVLLEQSLVVYIGCLTHGILLRLSDPDWPPVEQFTAGSPADAEARIDAAEDLIETLQGFILDKAMTRDDQRWKDALAERDAAHKQLDDSLASFTDYRRKLERFTDDVRGLVAKLPAGVLRSIEREHFEVAQGDTEILGVRFVEKLRAAWRMTDLDTKAEFLDRHFSVIEAGEQALGLRFKVAAPSEMYVPALPLYEGRRTPGRLVVEALRSAQIALSEVFQVHAREGEAA